MEAQIEVAGGVLARCAFLFSVPMGFQHSFVTAGLQSRTDCSRLSAASFYPARIPCLLGQSLIMVVLLSLLLSLVRANARAVAHPAAEGKDSLLWLFGVERFPEHLSPSSYLHVRSLFQSEFECVIALGHSFPVLCSTVLLHV